MLSGACSSSLDLKSRTAMTAGFGGRESPFLQKIRNPKSEIRNKPEIQIPKSETRPAACICLGFGISRFEFVSDFGFRISDFLAKGGWPCLSEGASLNSGGCFSARSGGNRAQIGETRKHFTDPTRTTSGDLWNGGERSGPAYPGRGFASRGEGRCVR
jgi:hypothetical protein